MAAQKDTYKTITPTSPPGTWEEVGLALLPYLVLKSCLVTGQSCLSLTRTTTMLAMGLVWLTILYCGYRIVAYRYRIVANKYHIVFNYPDEIGVIDKKLPAWVGSWLGFAFLISGLPILFMGHILPPLMAITILLFLFTYDKRLGLLAILPYIFSSFRPMDNNLIMVAIIITVIALVRWPMIDLTVWLPFYFNLVASFLLQGATISGIRIVPLRSIMSLLAVVVIAQLFWWLWQRVKEVPSDKGRLGYSLLLAGLILKTLSLSPLFVPMSMSFFQSPPPFLWQEWLLSFPVILAFLSDLLALFFLRHIFIRSGWLPLWFLIVTSPLVYTLRPLLETIRSRRATVPLWDIDLASLLPIRAEFIWLWLALVALAWLTIAGLYHKEKALPR